MKKLSITAMLFLLTALSFGQVPKAALYTSSTSDVYVGYITTFPDYGPHLNSYRFNGGEVAYTKEMSAHWGLIGSGAAVYGSYYNVKQYTGTFGAKYNLSTRTFRPYLTAQAGYSRQESKAMYAGDHHPPLPLNATDVESGLTFRGGFGADLQLNDHVYWRVLQWDVQPMSWGRHTPYYANWGSGFGYRF